MHDVYRFGAFTLDPTRRAVSRDGSRIPITPKAFDILLYLVEHPNQVVPKQDLMKAVWPDPFVEEANLIVNVSLLRKALADQGDDRLIVTVARRGYQFTANVTKEASPDEVEADRPPEWRRVALFGGLGLGLLLVGASIAWSRFGREPAAPDVVRLAVLPFNNLTGDTARNYLADGLTEELITHLARLEPERLSVIARTSVMQYRHSDKPLDQIGRDLSVGYAVESALQQSANRLRVSVRLVEVNDGRDLWAGDFDYGTQDVLHIEDSVASAVASAVRLRVRPVRRASLMQTASVDPIAVDAVIRGRDLYWYLDTRASWDQARRYFLRAIARDSNYALAWSWLGAANRYGAGRGFVPSDSAIPAARVAIDRALALDPNLPEAWEQRGQLERLVDWDWKAAAESYQRALALDPGSAEAVAYNGAIEWTLGHREEAIALQRRATELDPVDTYQRGALALAEYYAGHLDKADEVIRSIPLDVGDAISKDQLFEIYLGLGRVADAEALVPQLPGPEQRLRGRALVSSTQGRRQASDSALAALITQYHATEAYQIAEVYAFRGEVDSAFAWLDRGYAQRDQGLGLVLVDPLFVKLHGDARWPAFLTTMRLPH
jgi:TolB-like protein/DNA-binding winged helix-turn-helix (wHTH) protein